MPEGDGRMNLAIFILNLFVQQIAMSFYYYTIGRPKYSYIKTLLVMFFVMLIQDGAFYLLWKDVPMLVTYSAKFIMGFAIYYMMFDGRLVFKMLHHISFYVIALMVEIIVYSVIGFVFSADFETDYQLISNSDLITAGRIMAADILLLFLLVAATIYNAVRVGYREYVNELNDMVLTAVFVTAHFFFLVVFYHSAADKLTGINNMIQLAFQALLLSLILIRYYNTRRIRSLTESQQELRLLKAEMDNNYRYQKLADSKFDDISKLRHDLQNQLGTVRYLLGSEGGLEQAKSIMDNISLQLESVGSVRYCDNKALNAVLTVRLNDERAYGIKTNVDIAPCTDLGISDYDLCSLVSNMLDIAFDRCRSSTDSAQPSVNIVGKADDVSFTLEMTIANASLPNDLSYSSYAVEAAAINEICKKYSGRSDVADHGNVYSAKISL